MVKKTLFLELGGKVMKTSKDVKDNFQGLRNRRPRTAVTLRHSGMEEVVDGGIMWWNYNVPKMD